MTAGGSSREAYEGRMSGYSPGAIRAAALEILPGTVTGSAIDVGAGSGGWLRLLMAHHSAVDHWTAVDVVDDGAGAIENVQFVERDLSHEPLPVPSSSVNLVTALETIEHLANPRHLLCEIARSLRPDGLFLLSTPCNDSLRARASLMARGFFPEFNERSYKATGHITPLLMIDISRMAAEVGLDRLQFHFPMPGRLPRLAIRWPAVCVATRHAYLFADTLFATMRKPDTSKVDPGDSVEPKPRALR